MKKLIILVLTSLIVFSCSHEVTTSEEITKFEYNKMFEDNFGKIAPTQNWGFNRTETRTAMPNSNEWGTNNGLGYLDYPQPEPITDQELADVLAVFNQKGETEYNSLINLENFFVQQVYTGPNGSKMNELATTVNYKVETNVINWYPYEAETIKTTVDPFDDIINNFNAGNCTSNGGCMLMWNSATNDFSFKTSQSAGQRIYGHWRMEKINGNYYVGFDHEAWRQAPANANEEDKRDYIYNDWIIKIVPGKGYSPKIKESGRIICEDLGTIGDFDFNDVVFDATIYEDGKTEITLLAAGGTLDITVAGEKVWELLGKMVNTGAGNTHDPVTFITKDVYNSLIDIPIIVSNPARNIDSYELSAKVGEAPQKICVPKTFRWPREYVSIKYPYPGFIDWVTGGEFWSGEVYEDFIY